MITDGQHRTASLPPKKGNCFFCLKDGYCNVVELPPVTVEKFMETAADDPLFTAVIQRVAKMQFVCCAGCQEDTMKQAEAIVDFIRQQHLTAKLKKG